MVTRQDRDRHRSSGNWLLVLALGMGFWLIVGLVDMLWFYVVVSTKGPPPPWRKIVDPNLPYWILAGLLTPPVVWIARRAPLGGRHPWRNAGIHLGGAILFTVAHVTPYYAVQLLMAHKPIRSPEFLFAVQKYISGVFDKEMLIYLVIVGGVFIHDYYRRYREQARAAAALELEQAKLRALLSQAQLEALKMQLQPHFLFNALHAISTLIMRGDSKAAHSMLLRLSHFLRMTLDSTDSQVVPLSVELEFLDAYLKIQNERFGERLRVDLDIDQRSLKASVPNLILQPLVENSIRHGIGSDPGTGVIAIRTRVADGTLEIRVEDDGVGISAGDQHLEGVGLANIRARLEALYPGMHELALYAADGGGTVARILVPFRLASGNGAAGESKA